MQPDMIRSLIFGMAERLDQTAAEGIDAVIQFIISGDEGGDFAVSISENTSCVSETRHPDPTLTLSMTSQTYIDLAMGRISGPQAFFKRKIKMSGDMNYALKLHLLFPSLNHQAQ